MESGRKRGVTKIKYKTGTGSKPEVKDATSLHKGSQVNYYNALFDASISEKRIWTKAFGKLLPGQIIYKLELLFLMKN